MNECAIVPATGRSSSRAASTFDVAANPTIALARAAARAASTPCVRRNEKSTIVRPSAAITYRAAFDAIVVWSVTWFSRTVSTSCATAIGAVTSMIGSFACTILPSGIAHTSPPNRRSRRSSIARSSNPIRRRCSSSSGSNENPSRNDRQSSRPAATRNPRSFGMSRT
jgi:hypothetical protein